MIGGVAAGAGAIAVTLPAAAPASVDPNSITSRAEIQATADAGVTDTSVTDGKARSGFSRFEKSVGVRARGIPGSVSMEGYRGRANANQSSVLLEDGSELLGVDTRGMADSSFTRPNFPLGPGSPGGDGLSDFELGFDVKGGPVQYSLTGTMEVSVTASDAGSARTRVRGLDAPDVVVVTTPSDQTISENIDLAGTLAPGSHSLQVDLHANSAADFSASGAAVAQYDLKLRFCTITVQAETTNGTEGDDVICGTEGDDTIRGHGGNDRIFGFGGADTLEGGAADDDIDGGDGDDARIYGGPGDDTIVAGFGDDGEASFASVTSDVVAGGPGNDEINGGPGVDVIVGRCGGVEATVCPSDPVVPGEADDDNLAGGDGLDILRGDGGVNFIEGGGGNDLAFAGDLGDTLVMGAGDDGASGGEGDDRIEGGPGNDGDDPFAGNLFGGGGSDCLIGGSGRDFLDGVTGNDTLIAKDNARDKAVGGPGADRGRFDPQDNVTSVANQAFAGSC